MVICRRCQQTVPEEDTHFHYGQKLCVVCYIKAIEPPKPSFIDLPYLEALRINTKA